MHAFMYTAGRDRDRTLTQADLNVRLQCAGMTYARLGVTVLKLQTRRFGTAMAASHMPTGARVLETCMQCMHA